MKPIYKLNEKYFEIIDTEEKSYFLGIIFADGYLHEKRNYMALSVQDIDVDILEKLKNSIETNKPLQYVIRKEENTKNQYRLLITRKKVISDLKNLGVTQNKSLTANHIHLPELNEDLTKHFLRGYYDGDGSITFYKTRNTFNSTINICCTIEFFNFFSDFIKSKLNITCILSKRYKNDKNIYDLRICGNRNVSKFLDYIYKDSSIYLNRKWVKYEDFKNSHNKLNKLLGDSVNLRCGKDNLWMTFNSFKSASEYFNIPLTTFKRKVKKECRYLGYKWEIDRI